MRQQASDGLPALPVAEVEAYAVQKAPQVLLFHIPTPAAVKVPART